MTPEQVTLIAGIAGVLSPVAIKVIEMITNRLERAEVTSERVGHDLKVLWQECLEREKELRAEIEQLREKLQ